MAIAPINKEPAITIGRDRQNDVVVSHRAVSRQHAMLVYRDNCWTVSDLGSTNGTFVNDERISSETPLKYGDRIRLAYSGPEYIFPTDFSLPIPVEPPKKRPVGAFRTQFSRTLLKIAERYEEDAPEPPQPPPPPAPPPSPPAPLTPEQRFRAYFERLAELSPRSAVLESWRITESALRHRYHEVFWQRSSASNVCIFDVIKALQQRQILKANDVTSLHDLRDLRNKAAHHTILALTPAQASAYVAHCLSYARKIHVQTINDMIKAYENNGQLPIAR